MIRNTFLLSLFCLLLTSSTFSSVAVAKGGQQPVERAVSEPVKTTAAKARVTKPASGKTSSPKSTTAATAKVTDKPGKRFWGRIMDVFRDVHSAEKKPNK